MRIVYAIWFLMCLYISIPGSAFAQEEQQSIDRQKLGTAKPFEVFQTQEFYLQARIDYPNAVISYNKAQFLLKDANGQNL